MLTGEIPYKSEGFDRDEQIIFKVGNHELDPLKSMKNGGHQNLLSYDVEVFLTECFNM